jgi:hypothetical protein
MTPAACGLASYGMADFLLTYPCYFVLRANGSVDTVRTASGKAVCLFTDDDLAERYCRAKRDVMRQQLGMEVNEFTLVGFQHAEGLLTNLHQNAAGFAERGVQFVAIDPTAHASGTQSTLLIGLDEFRDSLERTL